MSTPLRFGRRGRAVLVVVSIIGLVMFGWPLWVGPESQLAHSGDAAAMFAVVLGMLIVVLTAELSSGGMDAKALAMLGVLAAVAAALRPLGAGASGFQPMFVVLILGGRALGPGFGFLLGLISMFGSALLTGGVGPWLPFQMLGAAWVGMGAGLLPRADGKRELALLAGYGAVAGVLYGFCLNMWFWPFLTTAAPGISFEAGAPLADNLGRFLAFSLITSLGFDLLRAVGNIAIIVLVGGPLLRSIRRASRRANFAAAPVFEPSPATPPPSHRTPGRRSRAGSFPQGASPSPPLAAPVVPRAVPGPASPARTGHSPGSDPARR